MVMTTSSELSQSWPGTMMAPASAFSAAARPKVQALGGPPPLQAIL